MFVSGNNLSACVGPAVGSRIISKRFGMFLGAAGFSLGLLFQGSGMTKTINTLLPNLALQIRAEALIVAIIIFVAADLIRVPLSFSMSLVGLLAGFSLATGQPTNGAYVTEVVALWIAGASDFDSFCFLSHKSRQQDAGQKIFGEDYKSIKYCLLFLRFLPLMCLGQTRLV